VQPTVLLIPCVAVDAHGYRLGYGGGFYDRTLQRARPRPLSIGISLASAILPTIHPQPHDIALDAVLTEHGWHRPLPAGDPRCRPASRCRLLHCEGLRPLMAPSMVAFHPARNPLA
jgi:hypothetical protein